MTMTFKSFIRKATKAKSAEGFIVQYREYLQTGELAPLTASVLTRLDTQGTLPASALKEITQIVFDHMMANEIRKAEESLQESEENDSKGTREPKAYTATLFQGDTKFLSKGFDLPQAAERWVDQRLVGLPNSRAEITASKVLNSKGEPMMTQMTREEAFARVYKGRKMASHKRLGVRQRKLGFEGRAKQDHCHFSHG